MKHPEARIRTEMAEITVELFPEQAPNTVASFIRLAREGVFDGQSISRIVPGFVIQPFFLEEDERMNVIIANESTAFGFDNTLPFVRGTVAMGAAEDMASGSSFFFTLTDEAGERLNGRFPAFGLVRTGFEELDRIEHLELKEWTDPALPENVKVFIPAKPERILSITVETWGDEYPEPVYLSPET